MKQPLILLASILFLSFFACNDEFVEQSTVADAENVIQVDSELYGLIENVVTTSQEESDITCIDFVYPFTVFTYDADLMFLDSRQIGSDLEFSELLTSLDSDNSISISLPIVTILDGGLSLNISSYEELLQVIEECMTNDFFQFCNANLPSDDCVWKVIENGAYTGAYFIINDDGSATYIENGTSYIGTWIVLVINDEVHLNINLEGNSETAVGWNHDWLITLTAQGHFQINNGAETLILEKDCEASSCNSLTFEECETIVDSGLAEFDLSSYVDCILFQSNIVDPTAVTVTFHETQADADANTNAITGPYTNTVDPQDIYVRIEDNMTGNSTLVSITLVVIAC